MSVLKSNRGESPVQFLDTARKIEVYTLHQVKKIPKRFTFLLATHVVKLSQELYDNVKRANSIYPKDAETVAMRRKYFIEANRALQCLISQIDIVKEVSAGEIGDKQWVEWGRLLAEEAKLISKVMRSDAEKKF